MFRPRNRCSEQAKSPPLGIQINFDCQVKLAADQRSVIEFVFQRVLLSSSKDSWLELGTIADIIRMLLMPDGGWGTVYRVLVAIKADPHFDVCVEAAGKGKKAIIRDGIYQAEFVYRALEAGNSIATTIILLNNMLCRRRLANLSHSTCVKLCPPDTCGRDSSTQEPEEWER